MRHAIILGIGSDIGSEIGYRLGADGWNVSGYKHDDPLVHKDWDLIVCCYGTLKPIGEFWEQDDSVWEHAFYVNLFTPLRQIKSLYPFARIGSSVCLFSGAGSNGPAPTYSAYAASKVALIKMVELMDSESDCKFFILGPGMMKTKIQYQTIDAGERATNFQRVSNFLKSDNPGTSYDTLYEFLKTCIAAPKSVVGGRNFYVPGDDPSRLGELADNPDLLKLRRYGDEAIRRR